MGRPLSAPLSPSSPTPTEPAVQPEPEDLVRVVALDGPAGTGKSTVARLTAARLGWRFVDTGATYRAVTLAVLRNASDPEDASACTAAARDADIRLNTDPSAPGVWLDGEDVSSAIRSAEVTAAVSAVSSHPGVRQVLVALQRRAIGRDGAVVEGRDIATVVAPRAAVKVYLDARPEVRAARRAGELATASVPTELVQAALAARDRRDSETNALSATDGAVHLETSELTLEQVVDEVVALVAAAGLVGTA
jgi:cytidylate kinase